MGYLIAISVYLLALVIYGLVIAHKKVKTADDMVTGGHRIPFIILVGSLLATWCGGGGITGSAGVVYSGGPWVGAITFAAPPIGIILLYFIAGKVRKSNKVTVPEIMEARYGKAASIISALCVMLAYVGVLATQLKAAADILVLLCSSSGVELSHGLALTICTVVIVVITVGGGLVSVAYSDAISALIMIGGFFLAIPFLISVANSQGAVLPPEKTTITGGMSGVEILGYFLPSLALMLGDQNMLQRFASAKNSDEAKKSNIGMFIGEILVVASIIALVTQAAKLYPSLETPSNVIFQVAVDYLPLAFGALVMCACMAFIVTTADSYLLSSATNLTNDIYEKYIRKDATDKQKMLVLRVTIVVFSAIAVALTLYFPTVLALQMTAYTMYGAAITPAILFALFSKRVTPAAGLAGIIVGGLATIVWTLMGTPGGVQCAIVAVPASVIAILLVSAVTKNSDPARSLDALYTDN
ncbi:sodium:solute symporter [Dysosmobacter sp.]|uniref:sodium:solute symporter family protein n=1 Tax=Dysosmobacter sp. TaxID=2591382 RepID=UPI002616E87B|nr:sodium:solute symporter family protein [Dysosmobacter sp.]